MSIIANVFGWIGVVLSIVMYTPQTYKVIKHKNAKGIAKFTFLIITFGTGMWIVSAPLASSWQGWSSNFIISFLMIPILYFVFKDQQKIFYAVICFLISTWVISSVFWWTNLHVNFVISIILIITAGGSSSASLIPQIIKLFKEKKVGEFSILSTLLMLIANALWTCYWTLEITITTKEEMWKNIVALMGTAPWLVTTFIILYFVMNQKYKSSKINNLVSNANRQI